MSFDVNADEGMLPKQISALLAARYGDGNLLSIVPCSAGGNNRTFRVTTQSRAVAAKQYFRHEGDSRDRLDAEYSFLQYASRVAPGQTPAPIAIDKSANFAIYEFVEGTPYVSSNIDWKLVSLAADFIIALNRPEAKSYGIGLGTASEACFSVQDHLTLISARLDRLRSFETRCDEDHEAKEIVEEARGRWTDMINRIQKKANAIGLNVTAPLESSQRCISPSDFGFHNALRQPDGTPRFLDFEYAGWDDPAKLAGDFFAQIAIPVPGDLFGGFVDRIMSPFERPAELVERASLLRPAFLVKWCCIALNVFLPVNLARRKFANPLLDEVALKRAQLKKARDRLRTIESL